MKKIFCEDKYHEFVDAVVSAAASYQRGSVMPWTVIESAMARGRDDRGGRQIIKRARARILSDREIVTLAVDGVGLRFMDDKDAASVVPVRRQKRAYRQLNRGLRETAAVRIQNLPDAIRLAFVKQRVYMKNERLNLGRAYRAYGKPRKKTETRPIRPRPGNGETQRES